MSETKISPCCNLDTDGDGDCPKHNTMNPIFMAQYYKDFQLVKKLSIALNEYLSEPMVDDYKQLVPEIMKLNKTADKLRNLLQEG